MPRISEFLGIFIYMYFSDHNPPHFHAVYGQFDAEFAVESGDRLAGAFPLRAERLVKEWADLYEKELLENWIRARDHKPLAPIPPLE